MWFFIVVTLLHITAIGKLLEFSSRSRILLQISDLSRTVSVKLWIFLSNHCKYLHVSMRPVCGRSNRRLSGRQGLANTEKIFNETSPVLIGSVVFGHLIPNYCKIGYTYLDPSGHQGIYHG